MIRPYRAPVRPRVISPEFGDPLPADYIWQEIEGRFLRGVEIVGWFGFGKTTTLEYLAATAPADRPVAFLDDAPLASVAEAAGNSLVVFTSLHTRLIEFTRLYARGVPEMASYRLAPWGNDELAEYLLAVHPAQCQSVMARIQGAPDRRLAGGVPEIWEVVLDRMAADESLATVSQVLQHEFQRGFKSRKTRASAERYCLEALVDRDVHPALTLRRVDPKVLNLLRHDWLRLILGSDHLAGLLEGKSGRKWLKRQMPRSLVKATGAGLSSAARNSLSQCLAKGPEDCQPMAASLLHATGTGWIPQGRPLPILRGAYLDGAAWKGVDLAGVRIEESDLSHSDLTEAVLDEAVARRALFRGAILSRASMVKMYGSGADFQMAELVLARATLAVLRNAILENADLSGARLPRANLRGARLAKACFAGADLSQADLRGAIIAGADFSSADLSRCRLDRLPLRLASFEKARFSRANLADCDLEGMELPGTDFSDANLEGSLLTGSRMPRASFFGARLRGSRLAEVDWEQADLRGADLRDCTFHFGSSRSGLVGSPIACEGSRTGFYNDEFDDKSYRTPEEIRKANLRGVDLRGADLRGTDFYLVDLRGATYTPFQREHLRRCGAILVDRS
jgi:uncharacterized protein YjbI with pentapeptide repeats